MRDAKLVKNYSHDQHYGFREIPFHRYLDLRISRPGPTDVSSIRLDARRQLSWSGGWQSPAAVYTLAEATGAAVAADMVGPLLVDQHGADVPEGMYMAMLTTGVHCRYRGPARGHIAARGQLSGGHQAAAQACHQITHRRKARLSVGVEVLDDSHTVVADAEVDLYLRIMTTAAVKALAAQRERASNE